MLNRRLCAVGVAACLGLAAPSLAQGLGDAAKKEEKRRGKASTPAKVYTQDDVYDLPPIANSSDGLVPAATAVPSHVTFRVAPSKSDAGQQDEVVWRGRANSARARVEKARATHEKAAKMFLVPGYEYVDKNGRSVIRSVEELQGLAARARANLDAAEKALDDLLEEARRAGVPPGWLR